ncbi:MAG: leucyl/phenylalanyl-tRNA--protein transferase [Sulfurovum sp.]|nr:MAG: Leucyl/phenylalanyl-tRNA--protein transferase [Arcobacter lacus]
MYIRSIDRYSHTFPHPNTAHESGILCHGGDLNPNRVIKAYLCGIFPWYNENDPILWWSPNPRCILKFEDFKVSKSLKKSINKNIYEIKFDTNFEQVIKNCQNTPRNSGKTWLNDEMIESYIALHNMGFAHSFESYYEGELVGGGYGISIGNIFCGESMFSHKNDASKIALYHLINRLKLNDFEFIDCQVPSDHLLSLGATTISRNEFLRHVENSLNNPKTF